MKIENIIKELFTSKEMSEYLIKNINDISKCKILEMILKAPIDLRRKGEILLELSKDETNEHQYPLPQGKMTDKEYYDLEFSLFNNSFKYNYDFLSKALSELETKNGDVFSVQNFWYDPEWPRGYGKSDFSCHSTFENALKYIDDELKFEGWDWNQNGIMSWYEIRKWSLTEKGDYEEIIRFYLNGDKLTHFIYFLKYDDFDYNSFEPDCHLNLITPFSTGDILTVDCRPQKQDTDILILENINNSDCCSLQCLYYDKKSKLFKTGAVKHASMYRELGTHFSPLYRITRATESLIRQDKFLYEIQKFLNSDPKKGSEMWLWINDKHQHKRKTGVTLNEIREYMEKKNYEQ